MCSFFKCLCFQIKSEVNSPVPCFELQLNCINPRNCQNLNHQLTLIGAELHIMINRNMLQEGEEELILLVIYIQYIVTCKLSKRTTGLLYCCTTLLLYYCSTVLLYYCTTGLLYYWTTVLLYYWTTVLLYYWTTVLLYY